jgi:hypothetical protein
MSASMHQAVLPDASQLRAMAARFVRTELRVDISQLTSSDRSVLANLIGAARILDEIFLQQVWGGNRQLHEALKQDLSELGQERLRAFLLNKGPWSALDEHAAFVPRVPARKPLGAGFYPDGMTREEFEAWADSLPDEQARQARGFFSVVRRTPAGMLTLIPYRDEYKGQLHEASTLLRSAAAEAENRSLQRFLRGRAEAFLTDQYAESDEAWIDLDSPIDVTIGPYETYTDELLGYKAAFEAYICVVDRSETDISRVFSDHLQDVENSLPLEQRFKNPRLGTFTPIRVVNEILTAGDANHGVRTAAFNLPNDEAVVLRKGSKKVMLKNVQRAKFEHVLTPIARKVLSPSAQDDLSFDWFFHHILAHEFSHGIGPQEVGTGTSKVPLRIALRDCYSAIEEAKADITGLFMIQLLFDRGLLPGGTENERRLYHTFLASAFRTLRFGVGEAHAQGMLLQLNFLIREQAVVRTEDDRFEIDLPVMKSAVLKLTRELLTLEAVGDYDRARAWLAETRAIPAEVKRVLTALRSIPVDIEPIFVTAHELVPPRS